MEAGRLSAVAEFLINLRSDNKKHVTYRDKNNSKTNSSRILFIKGLLKTPYSLRQAMSTPENELIV